MPDFVQCIRDTFEPLATQHRMEVLESHEDARRASMVFGNSKVGMRVSLDWREFVVFVTLFRREHFKRPPLGAWVQSGHDEFAADAQDVLFLRTGKTADDAVLSKRDLAAVRRVLTRYATALGAGASDVLSGDTRIFSDVAKIVAQRRRQFESEGLGFSE